MFKVRFRLLQHLIVLLFIAGEPQKVDRQTYISIKSSFHKLFKNTAFRHLRLGIGMSIMHSKTKNSHCFVCVRMVKLYFN